MSFFSRRHTQWLFRDDRDGRKHDRRDDDRDDRDRRDREKDRDRNRHRDRRDQDRNRDRYISFFFVLLKH